MNNWTVLSMISLAAILAVGSIATGQVDPAKALVDGNTDFALNLYGRLAQEKGNLFFSPYSISSALAMIYDGAAGNTAAEMKSALRFPFDREGVNRAFAELMRQLQEGKEKAKYKLVIANRLFGQKDYGFLPSFLKAQRDFYNSSLEEVDFVGATEAARHTINAWVEKETNDKIKDLIKPGVLGPDSRLVLANAIYFKAAWLDPFNSKRTIDEQFFTAPDRTVRVPTMHANMGAGFFKADTWSALELPYEGRQLSMVVFLPSKMDGLAELEKELGAGPLTIWLAKLGHRQVDVALPKFTLTGEFELNKVLMAMGMRAAFTTNADFSNMATRDKLAISAVIHKAFIDVNETGTEAAAATAVGIRATAMPRPAAFHADHPFVYLIKDNRTGAVLFMGRVVNPT